MTATINGHAFVAKTVTTSVFTNYKMIKGVSGSESVTLFETDSLNLYSGSIYSATGAAQDSSVSNEVVSLNSTSNSEDGTFAFTTSQGDSIVNGTYSVHW